MNASKSIPGLFALAIAFGFVGNSRAQTDYDHNAHHTDVAQTQTTPTPGPGRMGGSQSGMPGMMGGSPGGAMGGNMSDEMREMLRERMGQEEMGRPRGLMGGIMRSDHVEGRIAFMRAELGITDAQQAAWSTFADALRKQASTMHTMREQTIQGGLPETWPDRLALEQRILSARLDAVKAVEGPARALYTTLSPEQQKKANELMSHGMRRL